MTKVHALIGEGPVAGEAPNALHGHCAGGFELHILDFDTLTKIVDYFIRDYFCVDQARIHEVASFTFLNELSHYLTTWLSLCNGLISPWSCTVNRNESSKPTSFFLRRTP